MSKKEGKGMNESTCMGVRMRKKKWRQSERVCKIEISRILSGRESRM